MDIARAAEGGMRDAISLMDLCMSYSQNHITAQVVQDALGTAGSRARFDFADALATGDAGKALTLIDELMRAGREPAVFAREMTRHLRGVLVACACPNCAELLDVTDEDAALPPAGGGLRFGARAAGDGSLRPRRAGDALGKPAADAAGNGRHPRLSPSFDQSVQALTERIDALERSWKAVRSPPAPSPRPRSGNTAAPCRARAQESPRPVPRAMPPSEGRAARGQDHADAACGLLENGQLFRLQGRVCAGIF